MSRKPSKPETRIEDYLDVMTGGNAALPQPILRIEFYYAFLAGMTVELPQPILDDEKLLAKICGMEVEAPTYIPGLFPRLYAYMAKKGGQDVQVPDPILRLERYWYDYSAGEAPSVQEYTGAVPVTFVADGTPLLDLLISGNEEHSGTPTPDSPVMPQGTGERTGNLFELSDNSATENVLKTLVDFGEDVTFDIITCSCVFENLEVEGTYSAFFDYLMNDGTHQYVSLSAMLNVNDDSRFPANVKVNGNYYNIKQNITFRKIQVYLYTTGYNKFKSGNIKWAFYNSDKKDYEPYGYKIPISSANTTTPVYLGEVETTRKIKKLVLTGSVDENWTENTSGTNTFRGRLAITEANLNQAEGFCTHVPFVATGIGQDTELAGAYNSAIFLRLSKTICNNLADFKAYLAAQYAAGTPVTVWYVLATPETAVVNEPLMRIGDYADTLSMEQAGVQIPTANGSTTLDVETTVPPSEVYIKYRGEAVTTLSSLPAEVSSPEAVTEEENPEETEEEENEC